jgi:hypothetical protein
LGRTTHTDTRSQRSRTSRRGGQLLTRAGSPSCKNGLPIRVPRRPPFRTVAPYARPPPSRQNNTRTSASLHTGYQCHRVPQRPVPPSHPPAWPRPQRAGRAQGALPGHPYPAPLGEVGRSPTQDLVLLLQHPDPFVGLTQLRRLDDVHAGPDAVFDVSPGKQTRQTRLGGPETLGDLRDRLLGPACVGDRVTAKLWGMLSARRTSFQRGPRSSQVGSQSNRVLSLTASTSHESCGKCNQQHLNHDDCYASATTKLCYR